jgi:hypothetical protein
MSMHSKCNVTTVNLLKLSVNEARRSRGLQERGRKHVIRTAEDCCSRFFVFFIVTSNTVKIAGSG